MRSWEQPTHPLAHAEMVARVCVCDTTTADEREQVVVLVGRGTVGRVFGQEI